MANILIKKLEKVYKQKTVLYIEELAITQNQVVGLIGNNGAGKTTLFRLILDLISPHNGSVYLNGIKTNESEDWKKFVSSFIDHSFLLDFLSPLEYFYFIGNAYGISRHEVSSRLQVFEAFFNGEILNKQKKFIRDLSSGNKQKVGIAGVFITQPEIIILDEPFNALDPTSQLQLRQIIAQYHSQHQAITLISSHDLNHITEVSNRILLLEKGKIIHDIGVTEETPQLLRQYFENRIDVV